MDFEETNINETDLAEDSLPEELVEDGGDNDEELDTVLGDEGQDDGEQDAEEDKPGAEGPKEPGYVQKRITKAVQKAVAETEARFTAQMQAMEAQYAPIKERLLEMDAQELVRSGKVKDLETARELVRYRQGMPQQTEQPESQGEVQPRQQNGQFAPKTDPAVQARIDMLQHQADRIRANGGPDVIAEWRSNKEVHDAVIRGEMDFYEVAEQMKGTTRRKPPSPMRSPNGANSIGPTTIESMSDAQFRKMDKMLDEGVRFTVKR